LNQPTIYLFFSFVSINVAILHSFYLNLWGRKRRDGF